jgi:hypothetical protein
MTKKREWGCSDPDCGVSTAIDDETLTFGSGELDDFGFWERPCSKCARAWEAAHPGETCWPFADNKEHSG